MDVKNLILGMVGIMVCAVMIGGALLPAVASAGPQAYYNDYGVVSDYSNSDFTATAKFENGAVEWVVDNNVISDYTQMSGGRTHIITTDSFYVWYDLNSGVVSDSAKIVLTYKSGNTGVNVTGISNIAISSIDGVFTVTYSGNASGELTFMPEWAFLANEVGDYRVLNLISNFSEPIYFNDVNQIYGANFISSVSDTWYSFSGEDIKINDTVIKMTIRDRAIGNDVYLSSVNQTNSDWNFTIDNNGADYTVNPYVFIVPYKVDSFGTFGGVIGSLFNTIPIVAVAGLVLTGIYVFISRK